MPHLDAALPGDGTHHPKAAAPEDASPTCGEAEEGESAEKALEKEAESADESQGDGGSADEAHKGEDISQHLLDTEEESEGKEEENSSSSEGKEEETSSSSEGREAENSSSEEEGRREQRASATPACADAAALGPGDTDGSTDSTTDSDETTDSGEVFFADRPPRESPFSPTAGADPDPAGRVDDAVPQTPPAPGSHWASAKRAAPPAAHSVENDVLHRLVTF